ncbi:MAG TPA: cytochrome c3 family protein, partial [Anaerolineaceae bacterium]|nr:cytochrome c3 family protein [Anaerolineaceae bacterium]
ADAYPYFFIDTNANGTLEEDEAAFPNSYNAWTARLAKAAFNYQTSIKDPGAYAHGGKYIIQLLYDSIEDLNAGLGANAVTIPVLTRNDPGHFDGSSEAFRHWDEDGAVPANCAKCHSAEGLPQFLTEGANLSVDPANGLLCESCHNSLTEFTFYEVEEVTFPSGAVVSFAEEPAANLCLNCHQGRESTTSVNARLGDAPDDEILEGLNFINVHYFAAGATLFGSEAKGVYEYEGQTYAGRFAHLPNFDSCAECHDAHALEVEANACVGCHNTAAEPRDIRLNLTADYDGDGDAEEGLFYEIETMEEALYRAIQAYTTETLDTPLIYAEASHPYFFIDTNANGEVDEGEAVRDNSYPGWSPRLLRAAYNFQYVRKDPGAFAHNAEYILQVLYDSLQDIGGAEAVSGMTRP